MWEKKFSSIEIDGKQILVVEDDTVDLLTVTRFLDLGFAGRVKWVHASSVKEAKKRLRGGEIDFILLDLGLPDASGVETVLHIRASAPEVPIVVLTGNHSVEIGLEIMDLGAEDFIHKNEVNAKNLVFALEKASRRHRQKQRLSRNLVEMNRSLEKLTLHAHTDRVTGLANARGLARWAREFMEWGCDLIPMLLVDVDNYKVLKGTKGPETAAVILRTVGERLVEITGKDGYLARLSGGRFAVVNQALSRKAARKVAEQLFNKLKKINYITPKGVGWITLSMRLVEIHEPEAELNLFSLKADKNTEEACRFQIDWSPQDEVEDDLEVSLQPPGKSVVDIQRGKTVACFFSKTPGFRGLDRLDIHRTSCLEDSLELALGRLEEVLHRSTSLATDCRLFVDLPARMLCPQLADRILEGIPSYDDRRKFCLLVQASFDPILIERIKEASEILASAGIQVGVHGLGNGRTNLDHLIDLDPPWLFLSPVVSSGITRLKERREQVKRYLDIFNHFGKKLVACGVKDQGDLLTLGRLGIEYAQVEGFPLSSRQSRF